MCNETERLWRNREAFRGSLWRGGGARVVLAAIMAARQAGNKLSTLESTLTLGHLL